MPVAIGFRLQHECCQSLVVAGTALCVGEDAGWRIRVVDVGQTARDPRQPPGRGERHGVPMSPAEIGKLVAQDRAFHGGLGRRIRRHRGRRKGRQDRRERKHRAGPVRKTAQNFQPSHAPACQTYMIIKLERTSIQPKLAIESEILSVAMMSERKKSEMPLAELERLRRRRRPSVLILEDDWETAQFLRSLMARVELQPETGGDAMTGGWNVVLAGSIAQARKALVDEAFDLQIVDRNLPDGEGLSDFVAPQRRLGTSTPILLLTEKGQNHHLIEGLNNGADRYIGKPFDPDVLIAEIQALTRSWDQKKLMRLGRLEVEFGGKGAVRFGGKDIALADKELQMLAYIAAMNPEPVTYDLLIENVWQEKRDLVPGALEDHYRNRAEVALNRLRKHLEEQGVPGALIHTARASRNGRGGISLKPEVLQPAGTPEA